VDTVTRETRPAGAEQVFTGSWLAIKLGVEPRELDRRRRAGELLAYRAERGTDHVYPAWQLDTAGRPLPGVAELVRTAREAGLSDEQLVEILRRRDGLTGQTRLADTFRAGRTGHVLAAVRAAAGVT
jgi:hypothetical protein